MMAQTQLTLLEAVALAPYVPVAVTMRSKKAQRPLLLFDSPRFVKLEPAVYGVPLNVSPAIAKSRSSATVVVMLPEEIAVPVALLDVGVPSLPPTDVGGTYSIAKSVIAEAADAVCPVIVQLPPVVTVARNNVIRHSSTMNAVTTLE